MGSSNDKLGDTLCSQYDFRDEKLVCCEDADSVDTCSIKEFSISRDACVEPIDCIDVRVPIDIFCIDVLVGIDMLVDS